MGQKDVDPESEHNPDMENFLGREHFPCQDCIHRRRDNPPFAPEAKKLPQELVFGSERKREVDPVSGYNPNAKNFLGRTRIVSTEGKRPPRKVSTFLKQKTT